MNSSASSKSNSVLSESGRLPMSRRRRLTSTGSKSSTLASETASFEKSSLPRLPSRVAISKGYIGMFSGEPSTLTTLFKIRPSEVAPTTVPFGTTILRTSTPDIVLSSDSTLMGGIVLLASKAARPTGSACFRFSPVGVPSSSTPRYRTPPSELNIATTASTSILSSTPCFEAFPVVSLLNSTVRLSFEGISIGRLRFDSLCFSLKNSI